MEKCREKKKKTLSGVIDKKFKLQIGRFVFGNRKILLQKMKN